MKQRSVLKVTLTERFAEQLKTVIFAIFVLNVLDGILTIVGVTTGTAVEANPLMANLISYHPVLFMLCKLVLVFLGSVILWRSRHNIMAAFCIFLLFFVYYAIIIYQLKWINLRYLLGGSA